MQARNPENSDEIRPTPVRHLDLATPAFYHYRKNPQVLPHCLGKKNHLSSVGRISINMNIPFEKWEQHFSTLENLE